MVESQHLLCVGSNMSTKTKQSSPNVASFYPQIDLGGGGEKCPILIIHCIVHMWIPLLQPMFLELGLN